MTPTRQPSAPDKTPVCPKDLPRLQPPDLPVGQPLTDAVYTAVRDAIVEGRYCPGEKIVQERVADELGVSRTPVREALGRLAQEDLVRAIHGSGYIVSDLTNEDIDDVFQVRRILEAYALRSACGRLTRVQHARIEVLIEEMAEAEPTNARAQFDLNRSFHQAMVEPCGNRFLLTLLDQMWDHPVNRRITRSYIDDRANVAVMIEEHRQLLRASLDNHPQLLITLAQAHMSAGYGEALCPMEGEVPDRRGHVGRVTVDSR